MARRKSEIQADAPGQDSFLDVVANLVGIMIILIMVVGFAAKKAIVEDATASLAAGSSNSSAAHDQIKNELLEAERSTAAVESDLNQTLSKIEREKFEVAFRRAERDKILLMLSAAERAIQDKRGELDSTKQGQFDLSKQLAAARSELDEIQRAKLVAERAGPIPGVIEHLPTPMATTVFGKEIHFRLLGHRLAYIPWDELVERLKVDFPHRARNLGDTPRLTETLGPVQGFWMRYTMRRVDRPGGHSGGRQVELERFTMMSERDDFGEPIEAALRPQSEMHTILSNQNSGRATVTVWVYPDSFGDYRLVKQDLFKLGFLCAARPLPDGHSIGASPDGSRSSAQ